MKHMLTLQHVRNEELWELILRADEFAKNKHPLQTPQHFVANLFFEASTRTKCSFEVAERKLGLSIIPFEASTSSVEKGESLYDTVKTLEAIGVDLVVIRHPREQFYAPLMEQTSCALVNAGDGCGDHPTQSLLDLLTIYQEFGGFKDLNIVIAGDIRHSRVARSNVQMLHRLGAKVMLSGPERWRDTMLEQSAPYRSFSQAVREADVVMMLRVQKERHDNQLLETNYLEQHGLSEERAATMKPTAIVMHPAPVNRGIELADALVEAPNSRIFKQMENGVYARMAVIRSILETKRRELTHGYRIQASQTVSSI
ncbi:aspartate carbamoyltransferase catalytic subunit [Aureibacillus halotolerans]|uniref:Aspartate carbamoyltransferase n=1 Tax=Aureibacillus halotolerans TaxID=1508390 RepID=A0A4R6U745_9BACI|nr:aspartate carbamoyltransferase catalytic subunit [Aureibacillus halotolerans]TDQ42350.1 aspartate carbamoyltransferase [Aureibacillus halotolerans]